MSNVDDVNDARELRDLISREVQRVLDELRPMLVIAATNIAMASLDAGEKTFRDIINNAKKKEREQDGEHSSV